MPDPIPTPAQDQPTTTISAPAETSVSTTTAPSDPWIARGIVLALGSVTLTCVIGGIIVAANGGTVPGEVISIGSGAGGAMAALLSRIHG